MRCSHTTLVFCVALWTTSWPTFAEAAPLGPRAWTFKRDEAGRIVQRRDPAGREASYRHDEQGNLQEVRYSDGTAVSYTYTPAGLRESMTDSAGTTRYEYDLLGRPTAVHFPSHHTVKYRYDLRGLLRRIELSDGWWMAYEYDLLDRLITVDSELGKVEYAYHPARQVNGRPEPQTVRTLPNGVTTTWSFDADMRLVSLRHEHKGTLLAGWEYEHDSWGRINVVRDLHTETERRYAYDTLGRLTGMTANGQAEESYEYDAGSNQVAATRSGKSETFGHDSLGQLTTVNSKRLTYNEAGEVIARESRSQRQSYGYDAEGRLAVVSGIGDSIHYKYDGDGNLVQRRRGDSVEQHLYHVAASLPQLLATYDRSGRPMAHFVLGPNHLAVEDGEGTGVTFLLEDHLQSVRLSTDAQGHSIGVANYTAFGSADGIPTEPPAIGFAGEWQDPDTGLVFLRARWYDPRLARFIKPDPYVGTLVRPISLNRYTYAWNDPVNCVDPSGLQTWHGVRIPRPIPGVHAQTGVPGREVLPIEYYAEIERITNFDPGGPPPPPDDPDNEMFQDEVGFDSFPRPTASDFLRRAQDEPRAESPILPPIRRMQPSEGIQQQLLLRVFPHSGAENRGHERAMRFHDSQTDFSDDVPEATISVGREHLDLLQRQSGGGPPPPPGGGATPAVGGVYLDVMAELLGQAGPIRGARYDVDGNRLVLLSDRAETDGPGIRADDFAVALRSVYLGEWPGVSIDPDPEDPRGPILHYRYLGPTENTHFGLVMGQADRLMKNLGLGEDNEQPGTKVRAKADGFKDQFEWGFELGTAGSGELWDRFWIVPRRVRWRISPDGKTLWCKEASMQVKTEVMTLDGGRLVPTGRTDPAADAFAGFLTDHYDGLAREYPVFDELRQLAKLVGLAAWLQRELPPEVFEALVQSLVPTEAVTPTTTPSLTRQQTREANGVKLTLNIYGGVDLDPQLPAQLLEGPGLAQVASELKRVLPPTTVPTVADLTVGEESCQALAIPLTLRSGVGSLSLRSTDMVASHGDGPTLVLARHYNSTRAEIGAFGRGWTLLVPEIRFSRSAGRDSAWITDAWRTFELPVEAPSFRRIERSDHGTTLAAGDGSVWEFGPNHKLARIKSAGADWRYEYDGGRIKRFSVSMGDEGSDFIKLAYNDAGRIVAASDASQNTVAYEYDEDERLVTARSNGREVRYVYDSRHRLTLLADGAQDRRFEYDQEGYLVRATDEAGHEVEYRREATADGGIRIRRTGTLATQVVVNSRGRVTSIEQAGRVLRQHWDEGDLTQEFLLAGQAVAVSRYRRQEHHLEREFPGDRSESYKFNPDGSPAWAEVVAASDGARAQIEFDPAGRPVRMTDPAGGEYRHLQGGSNASDLVTPTGRYSIRFDEKSQTMRLRSPGGGSWTWRFGPDNELAQITAQHQSSTRTWIRASPKTWQLTENGNRITKVQTDELGRVTEVVDASGATVRARHGESGSVATTPDGRHLVVGRDAAGRIRKLTEHPAGSETPELPRPIPASRRDSDHAVE